MLAELAETDIVSAVTQTVFALFHDLDSGKFERVARLFADDGMWLRQGAALRGPDAVLAALQARPAHLVTRHLVSNLLVTPNNGGAVALYHVLVFDHDGAELPAPLTTPRALFTNHDELVRRSGAWLFRQRTPSLIFKRA